MIDNELHLIVIEFIAEMLNNPHCESVLLDIGEDAILDSDLPILYMDVTGKQYGCTLSIVGDEYSLAVRDRDADETITTVRGREGAWELQELLAEIKTKLQEGK